MENLLIILATVVVGAVLVYPRVSNARFWRATITPLASIIGSGFLVLGPILSNSYGVYAPLIMALLCLVAYLFGAAIRYNITVVEQDGADRPKFEQRLETLASWTLAFAYFISVAYYLNLFGAFGVRMTPYDSAQNARVLTSMVLLVILAVGWLRGFAALERMEQVSVGIKLAIIAGLLVGLGRHFAVQTADGALVMTAPTLSGWGALTLAFGLIVTVQGFETSRYLGDAYDGQTRRRSMLLAQAISTLIYMIYIGFLTYVIAPTNGDTSETAIIDMMAVVAPILPVMLVVAALAAQFSAAVADTSGSGGLIEELSGGRVRQKNAYLLLVLVGLALTWSSDVFQIINYASRAFALYYGLQSAIAAAAAWRRPDGRWHAIGFAALALLGVMIVIFGTAVE